MTQVVAAAWLQSYLDGKLHMFIHLIVPSPSLSTVIIIVVVRHRSKCFNGLEGLVNVVPAPGAGRQ